MGLVAHGLLLATATKSKSGSSATLLLLVGFGLLVYLFVLRPRSQKMRKAQQQNRAVDVGDEVMLTSGIIGRVTGLEGDRATVEIAPEIEVEVIRRAIGQVLDKAEEQYSLDVPPDPGSDEHSHDEYADDDLGHENQDAEDSDDHDDAPSTNGRRATSTMGSSDSGPRIAPEPDELHSPSEEGPSQS
ncbi:MAG: preprotein translocase subunit YajC [Acidimicrobiales bacterium]